MPHIHRAEQVDDEWLLYDERGVLLGRGPTALEAVADMYRNCPPLQEKPKRQLVSPCEGIYPAGNRWRAMCGRKYLGMFATYQEAYEARIAAMGGTPIKKWTRKRKLSNMGI